MVLPILAAKRAYIFCFDYQDYFRRNFFSQIFCLENIGKKKKAVTYNDD